MAQEIVNVGGLPNDKTGDPLRTAFSKINNNFSEVYARLNINTTDGSESLSPVITYQCSTSDPNQIMDSIDATQYNSVKYMIETTYNDNIQLEEISLLHDGQNVHIVKYAQMKSGILLSDYSGALVGNQLKLLVSPVYDLTKFKAIRTLIPLISTQPITLNNASPNQLIDSLDALAVRSAKYIIETKYGTNVQVEEFLVMHDNTDAYVMSYANIKSSTNVLAVYSAALAGSVLKIVATPAYSGVKVKFSRVIL